MVMLVVLVLVLLTFPTMGWADWTIIGQDGNAICVTADSVTVYCGRLLPNGFQVRAVCREGECRMMNNNSTDWGPAMGSFPDRVLRDLEERQRQQENCPSSWQCGHAGISTPY